METTQAIKYTVWHTIRNDKELQEIFGGKVRLHWIWAPKDAEFPYLTYRMSEQVEDSWILQTGDLHIDIWDYHDNASRLEQIQLALKRILDHAILGLVDGGSSFQLVQPAQQKPRSILTICRIYMEFGEPIPDPTEGIWHYAFRFSMRFTRSLQEVQNYLGVDSIGN